MNEGGWRGREGARAQAKWPRWAGNFRPHKLTRLKSSRLGRLDAEPRTVTVGPGLTASALGRPRCGPVSGGLFLWG